MRRHLRPSPLLGLLLAACAQDRPLPDPGYDFGQLASVRDTTGPIGLYDPELAGCAVTRTAATLVERWEYDREGRQQAHRVEFSTGWTAESRTFAGPCVAFSRTESASYPPVERTTECDVAGWPQRSFEYGQDQDGAFTLARGIWFDNHYTDDQLDARLWEVDGAPAQDEIFVWEDGRLVGQAISGRLYGVLDSQSTWIRDRKGRALERTTAPNASEPVRTTWERDARGRVLNELRDGLPRWTWLYEEGLRWPTGRIGPDPQADADTFRFDCP